MQRIGFDPRLCKITPKTNKTHMRIIAAMLCLGIGIVAMAQPSSEFQIGNAINKVQWMQQSNTGTLVLATNSAFLSDCKPAQQKVAWEIKELGSAKEEDYSNIEGTPYFLVTTRATLGLGKPQTSIIRSRNRPYHLQFERSGDESGKSGSDA